MYCKKCGQELVYGGKFCSACGAPTNNSFDEKARKEDRDEKINKCSCCGARLNSFVGNCSFCGTEIRGDKNSESIREFSMKLIQMKSNVEKINLVRNFPVPNTKEDILEFMILATTNLDASDIVSNSYDKEMADAWLVKFEQCYQKAKLVFRNDADFSKIQNIYEEGYKKISQARGAVNRKIKFNFLARNSVTLCGMVMLLIAVGVDYSGGNSSLIELIGCIVLIATASTLKKRKAELLDVGVCAISGVLQILLAFVLSNGSLFQLCGGITLIIVAVNFFACIGNNTYK